MTRAAAAAASIAALFVPAACSGDGSDIGPRLARLPGASGKVVVLDGSGRGVCGAAVSVVGTGARAITGRNGRGELFADLRGRRLVRVDGTAAAAIAADRLGVLTFATTFPDSDLGSVVHLPDTRVSLGLALTTGLQASTAVLSDAGNSGVELTIGAGTFVGELGGATAVTIRSASLRQEHLPGDLPAAAAPGNAMLFGRGIYVDPPTLTFTPAADVSVTDDLLLPGAANATLFRLDSLTGAWVTVATNATQSGGRLALPAAVAAGGLYVFGVEVPAATVIGRLVDAAGAAIGGAMVRVDGWSGRSAGGGAFTATGIPATLADGSARSAAIRAFAGALWVPATSTGTVAVSPGGTADAGNLTLDTLPGGNVRVQAIKRGRAEPLRRLAMSTLEGNVVAVSFTDDLGQTMFEDMPARWLGSQAGFPRDADELYYLDTIFFFDTGRRWQDLTYFFDDRFLSLGARSSRVVVTDDVGTGPVRDAVIVRGSTDGAGFTGRTTESGALFVDRAFDGRATVTVRTEREGRVTVYAFTIERPNGEHLELPLRRVLRTPVGAFDRHGLVAGSLTNVDPGRSHRLRATRRLELEEWFDDVFLGRPIVGSLPVDVDPVATGSTFQTGVAVPAGHLAAVEVAVATPITTLTKVGIAADVAPVEGAVTARDLALDLPATIVFVAPQALTGLDAAFAVGDLAMSLALEQPSGRVVDVVRNVNGNHVANGADLLLTLPELTGQLAGHRWVAAVGAASAAGGVTVEQRSLLRFAANGAVTTVPMLAVPAITSPAPGATVAASGFTVQFALPPGTAYATLELVSQVADDLHRWDVVVPPDLPVPEFRFWRLPAEANTPLVAGRTYTLTLRAHRIDPPPARSVVDLYWDITTHWQTLGAAERGVTAVSSQTITVTAN